MSARYVRPPLPFDKAALVSDEVDVVAVYKGLLTSNSHNDRSGKTQIV